MTVTIDLLRHGKVDGPPALYGHTDVDVTPEGQALVRRQISQLPLNGQVFCSPLKRCKDVAFEFNRQTQVIDGLAEMDFGAWDGIPFDLQQNNWPQLEAFWQNPGEKSTPGGESLTAFSHRVIAAWQQVVSSCDEGHHLVVCHGGVIRAILAHVLDVDINNAKWFSSLKIGYASLTRITIPDHNNHFSLVNYINKEVD